MRSSDVLRFAKRVLELCGWHQGAVVNDGRQCMVGAVLGACVRLDVYSPPPAEFRHSRLGLIGEGDPESVECRAYRLLERALGVDDLHVWNDAPGRTLPEVLAAF